QSNQGQTSSSIDNITDVGIDYADISMSTWLPDFGYFDFIEEQARINKHEKYEKYNPEFFVLAYEYLR
ncbi:MAG: hypothetical protein ACTSPB_26370, partial [Candidatus Thorarchaeota archaeon]